MTLQQGHSSEGGNLDANNIESLITDNMETWTSAIKKKSATGRGSSKKIELYGIKKLRNLILELAVRGKLVKQNNTDTAVGNLLSSISAERESLLKQKKIRKLAKQPSISDKDHPFLIPKTWGFCRFGELTFNRDGERKPVSASDRKSMQGEYDYYGASGVIDKVNDYLFDKPLLLIGEDGANLISRSTPIAFIAEGRYWVNNHAHVIDGASFDFLSYLALFINAISLELYITGTAQPKMNQAKMNSIVVAVPPVEEQHRIVAKVDELMLLCDQLEQQTESSIDAHKTLVEVLLNTLTDSKDATELQTNWARVSEFFDTLFTTEHSIDQLKQTILQLAVMGKLVPQASREARNSPNYEPAAKLLERIADEKAQLIADKKIKKQKALPPITEEEKPFELPNGWEWCRLGDVLQLISDYHANGGYKILKENVDLLDNEDYAIMLRTTNFSKKNYSSYKYITKSAYNFLDKSRLFAGDIIMNKIGDPGASFFVNDRGRPMSLAMNLFLLRTQIVNSKYIYLYLKANYEYIQSFANGTSTQTITKEAVYNLVLPLCPINGQEKMIDKADKLLGICDQLKSRLNNAQQTQLHLADALVAQAVN